MIIKKKKKKLWSYTRLGSPPQLLLNQIKEQEEDGMLSSIGYNPWKEETECRQWLNFKEPKSVVYVSFGNVVVMTTY